MRAGYSCRSRLGVAVLRSPRHRLQKKPCSPASRNGPTWRPPVAAGDDANRRSIHDGIAAPFVIDRPMNGVIFRTYVERVLAPTDTRPTSAARARIRPLAWRITRSSLRAWLAAQARHGTPAGHLPRPPRVRRAMTAGRHAPRRGTTPTRGETEEACPRRRGQEGSARRIDPREG